MLKRWLVLFTVLAVAIAPTRSEDKPVKKLLLITDSGGFVHDSVGHAEKLLKELGPKYGWSVDCFRFTRDPDEKKKYKVKEGGTETEVTGTVLSEYSERFRGKTGLLVEKEHCGKVNRETLAKYDAVLFFTTGNPTNKQETAELVEWVKAGHAYAGVHCASDTLYQEPEYGALVGGYFDQHPWHQKVKLVNEDSKHPAGTAFPDGAEITDEIYQFKAPYSREKLHVILKVDASSIDTKKKGVKRTDGDFAVSWCQEVGKGKAFYTSLGHRKEVWSDERFQKHLFGGLDWAVGRAPGSASPSAASK